MEPVIANVNYQMQPVNNCDFQGRENWSVFQAAFENYACQQGFFQMLGDDGDREPGENPDAWRRKMAQATTSLTSGWLSDKI